MKTNVTLVSQSRELFGVTIRQETKTGHLNVSDLQVAYDRIRDSFGWPKKNVQEILSYDDNRNRIYYILKKQGFINSSLNEFTELIEKDGAVKTLKCVGVYQTKGRGANKTTVCNPYIWVLLAMEMNPMLYGEVVMWLTDKLILNRIEAGDMFKELSKAISRFHDVDYAQVSKALNYIVFGKHETGIRNTGTEDQLKELERLESNLAFAIESGLLVTFEQVMNHLRGIWYKKYPQIAA
jgi:hypothetical protein